MFNFSKELGVLLIKKMLAGKAVRNTYTFYVHAAYPIGALDRWKNLSADGKPHVGVTIDFLRLSLILISLSSVPKERGRLSPFRFSTDQMSLRDKTQIIRSFKIIIIHLS